jgi:hypothetical protein
MRKNSMKNKEQKRNESQELLKNPFFVFLLIIGSPFYVVYKIVHWASEKSEKSLTISAG